MILKALLFDMDGTLANTDPIHMLAWQETFRTYEVFIDDVIYHERIVGRVNPLIVKDFLPHLNEDTVTRIVEEKEENFKKLATKLEPLPGLARLLESKLWCIRNFQLLSSCNHFSNWLCAWVPTISEVRRVSAVLL